MLHDKLKNDLDFIGSTWGVRQILKNLGFTHKTMRDNRTLWCEKIEIQLQRATYLRKLAKYRADGKYIVYVYETCFDAKHSRQSNDVTEKNCCLFIVHGDGDQKFVLNDLVIFKPSGWKSDLQDDMDFGNFPKWLENQLLPHLPASSVIILDLKSNYNNVMPESKAPSTAATKQRMTDWLFANRISFDVDMVKIELHEIIKGHIKNDIKLSVDSVIEAAGHQVLRLPPHHSDLNPIESIWISVKKSVSERKTSEKLNDAHWLAEDEFAKITAIDWKKRFDHVRETEQKYREIGLQFDYITENVSSGNFEQDNSGTDDSSGEERDRI